MINKKLVKNYTTALFENALASGIEDSVLAQIKDIDQLIQGDQKVKDIMFSPIAKYSYKLEIIELITQSLHIELIVKQFLLMLLKHSRMSILSDIVELYQVLLNEKQNIKVIKVTSSKPLQYEEERWLQKYFEDNFQQKVAIKFEHNPAIIGGIIIEYGSLVKDYSIAGAFKKMNKALISVNLLEGR